MMIIGCDFHPRFQQISFLLEETGECGQRRLMHTAEADRVLPLVTRDQGASWH